ncbi:hypothetical protein [Roseovarius sp.]|uniref:hypothetical protein n=1 Tax=Roseovarius sp. TaxID=1486281 RepID=UPI003D0BAD32
MANIITLENGEEIDVDAFPLPEGVSDELFNMTQIAKAMNTSTVTITRWIDQGFPIHQKGGNGQAYEFRLSHCYAWRMWREQSDAADRARKDELAGQLAMQFLGGEEEAGHLKTQLSPKEMKAHLEVEMVRNQAALQREELVKKAHVERVLEGVLITFRQAMTNLPDYMEQEFSLSPIQVEKAEKYCDSLLHDIRLQMSEARFAVGEVVSVADHRGRSA